MSSRNSARLMMMRRQRGHAGSPRYTGSPRGPGVPEHADRRRNWSERADSTGLRLGLWALLATAAGAGAAYALKKRRDISVFERKFDPDAELQASRIPYPVVERPDPS